MPRSRGANASLALAFESTYGTAPGSGFRRMPFVSSGLGEQQGLIDSDLIGTGREPLAPLYDVINNRGEIVVPVDVRNFGLWLRGLMGAPVSAAAVAASGSIAFSGQPANNATITLNGIAWTFVSAAPSGNQSQIGANLGATLTNLVTALNASVVSQIAAATYAQTGGTTLTIIHDTLGLAGNAFALAAQPASNGVPSGATLAGGANNHTFQSGAQVLPSLSIETQLPDVPFFGMNTGAGVDTLRLDLRRSGNLVATLGLIAQGETPASTMQAGTLSTFALERFSQFQGEVRRNGTALGNIVSGDFTYSNNLEAVEVIRADGRIAGVDPGIVAGSGSIVTRFEDRTLLDQATNRQPCELTFQWQIDPGRRLSVTFHSVFLPRNERRIEGPGGIQVPFNWQAARDEGLGRSVTCVLTNDVASY
jgi:hypothetical protein